MLEKTLSEPGLKLIKPDLKKSEDKSNAALLLNPDESVPQYSNDNTDFANKINSGSSKTYNFVEAGQNDVQQELYAKITDPEIKSRVQSLSDKLASEPQINTYLTDLLFTRQPKLNKGQTVDILDRLSEMLEKKYQPGAGNLKALVISALKDVSSPFSISQKNIKNCAGAALQMQMLIGEPMEYLKMLDTLAQGQQYKFRGNDQENIKLNFNKVAGKAADSISAKIVYSAFDTLRDQKKNLIDVIFGDKLAYYELDTLEDIDSPETKFIPFIEQLNPSKENPVHITLRHDDQHRDAFYLFHITGIDKKENTATLINQKGEEEKMPVNVLRDKTLGIFMSEALQESATKNGNPLRARLSNMMHSKFNQLKFDSSVTVDLLKKQITDKYPQPELQKRINKLLEKTGNDKETAIYLNELILNRDLDLTTINTLLDKLNTMSGTKYYKKVLSNKDLVVSALHDIAAPANISQGEVGTCAGTSLQIQLAIKDPVQYLKMLDTLAKNNDYKTVSGKIIKPNWTFARDTDKDGKPDWYQGRTISCCIMQNSIMDFADGKRKYDSSSSNENISGGLDDDQIKAGKDALFGLNSTAYSISDYSPDQLMTILETAGPSLNNPVETNMNYSEAGRDASHAVNVININKLNKTVTIINPWGREEIFPIDKLKERITSVIDTKEAGVKVIKQDQAQLAKILKSAVGKDGTDAISKIINNSEKNTDFLNSLNMRQKAQVLQKILYSGKVSQEDKTAGLKILENIFQGSDAQSSDAVSDLVEKLNALNIDFPELLNRVKTDSKLFYDVAAQANSSDLTFEIAGKLINDPKTHNKFLANISIEKKIDIINSFGDRLVYDSASYPTDKKAMDALLSDLMSNTADKNKLYSEFSLKTKVAAINSAAGLSTKFMDSLTPDQKMLLFKNIGAGQSDANTTDEQLQVLQNASLALVRNMVKGLNENPKKALLKDLSVFIGRNNDLFQPDKNAFKTGVISLTSYLPPNNKDAGQIISFIKKISI